MPRADLATWLTAAGLAFGAPVAAQVPSSRAPAATAPAVAATGSGLDVYAASTGTDAGACQSAGTPCRTINYALTQALKADLNGGFLKIHLGAGRFSENVLVNGPLRGAASNAGFVNANSYPTVQIIGAGSGQTTIAGGLNIRGQSFCYAVAANNYATVALSGLTITADAPGATCRQSDIYAQFFGTVFVVADVKLGPSNGFAAFAEEYGAIIVAPGCGGCSGALTFASSAPGAIGLSDNSSFQTDSTIVFSGSPAFSQEAFLGEGNSTIKLAGAPPTSGAFTGKLALLSSNTTMIAYRPQAWPGSMSSCTTGARMQGVGGPPGCAYAAPAQLPGGGASYNPTGATKTGAYVMMGLGAAKPPSVFTPGMSGTVEVSFSGSVSNSTEGDGAQVTLLYGPGAAPANGAALTGAFCGAASPVGTSPSANAKLPVSIRCVISGLTPGKRYWFDVGLAATTGGTATFSNAAFSAVELPQ